MSRWLCWLETAILSLKGLDLYLLALPAFLVLNEVRHCRAADRFRGEPKSRGNVPGSHGFRLAAVPSGG